MLNSQTLGHTVLKEKIKLQGCCFSLLVALAAKALQFQFFSFLTKTEATHGGNSNVYNALMNEQTPDVVM